MTIGIKINTFNTGYSHLSLTFYLTVGCCQLAGAKNKTLCIMGITFGVRSFPSDISNVSRYYKMFLPCLFARL